MADQISIQNNEIRDPGNLALIAFFAGEVNLKSKKVGLREAVDIFVSWTKDFEQKFENAREDPEGEHWDDKAYTFLFEKVAETQEEHGWTYL